jgi:DNA-binding NtrC family response regulator
LQAAHSIEEDVLRHPSYAPDYRTGWSFGQMLGRSPAMQRLFSQMRHTARHLRVATIEGESGTGKLLAARILHEYGLDSQSPFVPCSAERFLAAEPAITLVPPRSIKRPELSTLPALRQSSGGTLVLTRVDELSAAHQGFLLDLLQWIEHQHILREPDSIPHQILCLSGQSLRKLASTGLLLSDLASRLTAIRFVMPPLRERREDIPLLADLFARRFSEKHGKPIRGLGPQTLPHLYHHSWPGNVRELESVICSASLACHGEWIRPIDLPALRAAPQPRSGGRPQPRPRHPTPRSARAYAGRRKQAPRRKNARNQPLHAISASRHCQRILILRISRPR